MKKYLVIMIVGLALFSLVLISCGQVKVGYVGSNTGNHINSSYKYFNGTETRVINASAGNVIDIHYTSEVKKGELSLKVMDSSQNTVAKLEANTTGTKEIKANGDEKYELIVDASGTEGSFDVKWEVN